MKIAQNWKDAGPQHHYCHVLHGWSLKDGGDPPSSVSIVLHKTIKTVYVHTYILPTLTAMEKESCWPYAEDEISWSGHGDLP